MAKNPIVTFETTAGTITAELYPEIAPNTRIYDTGWRS